MITTPLPPHIAYIPPCMVGKLLVVNGDMHGRGFHDMGGNLILPGECAYLNVAHYEYLHGRNRFIQCLET